MFNSEFINS